MATVRTTYSLVAAILLTPTLALLPGVGNADDSPSSIAEQARAILEATGVRGGLVVHLGCGDGRLTATLRANDSYLVHGLDPSEENVAKAREFAKSKGGRVTIDKLGSSATFGPAVAAMKPFPTRGSERLGTLCGKAPYGGFPGWRA